MTKMKIILLKILMTTSIVFTIFQETSGNEVVISDNGNHGQVIDGNSDPLIDITDNENITDGNDTEISGNATKETGPTLSPQLAFLMRAAQLETFQIGLMIQRYCLPVIIILGLIGNTLSLAVMVQPQNRKISCCIYMAGLAISDNGSLIVMSGFWIITDAIPTQWTSTTCVIWVYFVMLTTCSSAFILVVVTADRCLAIRWPLKARVWCTASRARKILVSVYVFVAIVYIPIAYMSDVTPGNICAAFAKRGSLSLALSYINLILIPVIPFTLILIMNIIIIKAVRASGKADTGSKKKDSGAKETKADDSAAKDDEKMNARNRQLTAMLLVVSITYLIIMLPISSRVLAYLFIDFTSSIEAYAMFVLLYNAVNNLLFLNNAINFYLYCIAGAKFREDLKQLFCKKKK